MKNQESDLLRLFNQQMIINPKQEPVINYEEESKRYGRIQKSACSFGSSRGGALELVHYVNEQKPEKSIRDKNTRQYLPPKILLVGEGDFSFSVSLAKSLGSAANMVTTSLDSIYFLQENYPSATSNIGYLKNRGCMVIHDDATTMADHPLLDFQMFGRIIFNFPLAGFFSESKKKQLKRNRNLVRMFMKNAKEMIEKDGEILITHKTSATYREWGFENLGKQNGLKLIEDVEFKLHHYPGYHTKYGFGGNEDFHCYPSRTYKFGLK